MRALPGGGKRALPQALAPAVACRMVAMTGPVRRGIIGRMETRIPDFGDVVGLTRLYRQTVDIIRSMDIAEPDKQALIAEIEAQYKAAKAAAESGDDSQFWPLKPPGTKGG
jgi:hypothetical protein